MERGGFDAIIGNPPFLGGKKISGAFGSNFREWLVSMLAVGKQGNADLVSYFLLRAMKLLGDQGKLGLIATNSVAQGDTREVGLDQLLEAGFKITRSIQSRTWPARSANLEYAAIWGTRGSVGDTVARIADDVPVNRISALLEPCGRVDGNPYRLVENNGMAYIGCYTLGMGFVLEPDVADELRDADIRNSEVLFRFLNGEDLNSRPDCSASRWVIDFFGCSEQQARTYSAPYERLYRMVRPERAGKSDLVRKSPWWLFFNTRPAMRKAISRLDHVLVITIHSRTVMPVRVSTGQIYSHALGVFATDSYADQSVLSSSLHQLWAVKYGSGIRTDPRYTPSDVFETYPRPAPSPQLVKVGQEFDSERCEIMSRRGLGLTKLYNLINDPEILDAGDADVARLREIHVELDRAVCTAYGWDDVPLGHGFHTYRQMERWTVSPAARVEILDRLLEENHHRAALQGEAPPLPKNEDEGEKE